MTFNMHYVTADSLIRQCESFDLPMPAAITKARTAMDTIESSLVETGRATDQLVPAALAAIEAGKPPHADPAVIDALNARALIQQGQRLKGGAETNLVAALKDSAEELAAALVPGFEESVAKLEAAMPRLGGLDPLDPRASGVLRNSNDVPTLTAVVNATEASRDITARGELHRQLLAQVPVRTHHGIGKFSVVPIKKAIEVSPSTLQRWSAQPPMSALLNGLELKLLDRDGIRAYIEEFEQADEARTARLNEMRDDHVFGRITRAGR